MTAVAALAAGLRRVGRSWGLGVFLLAMNLGTALLFAAPLAGMLAQELHERPAATAMAHGFDYPWWSRWADDTSGWPKTLGPDLLGAGFAFKNADLLAKGQLPAGLFALGGGDGGRELGLDPVLLAVAAAFMIVQVFLAGGVLSVLRQAQGRWTVRGLLHGAGFYFGRFLRVWALMMLALAVLYTLYAPLAHWADARARESVSETAAHAWLFGRHAVLLLAIVFLHVVATYARVIIVLEERSSATLAVLTGLGFALSRLMATLVITGVLAALALLVLALWAAFDEAWTTTGFRSQIVTLVAMQAILLARILLRIALPASLMDLYRRRAADNAPLPLAA
jgi:hypothetical protein